jgi:hypothetical protein
MSKNKIISSYIVTFIPYKFGVPAKNDINVITNTITLREKITGISRF